jgi:hypothetical protein
MHSHAEHGNEKNKASALNLVCNAILYWSTSRIINIVDEIRIQGEAAEDDLLARISLLPYKHVLPNDKYFIGQEVNSGDE